MASTPLAAAPSQAQAQPGLLSQQYANHAKCEQVKRQYQRAGARVRGCYPWGGDPRSTWFFFWSN